MKLIKKMIEKIFNCITFIIIVFSYRMKILVKSIIFKKKIYLFGAPIHGNIGDQAIIYAEELFLKDNFNDYSIIEVPSILNSNILKRIVKDNIILYTGGGFLGSLWLNEEEMFRNIIKAFPNNKIIVFPQTFFFSDDDYGKKILKESINVYSQHNNLHLICREKYSYEFMKKYFSKCNIYLAPDMVLYLNKMKKHHNGSALLCLRDDRERINNNCNIMLKKLKKHGITSIDKSSTVVNINIFPIYRKRCVIKKIREFSKYEVVLTDRLHGMIFSYLSNTPCIVYENMSYKVRGVFEWIKKSQYIKFNKDCNEQTIKSILNNKSCDSFDKRNYDIIKELIEKEEL